MATGRAPPVFVFMIFPFIADNAAAGALFLAADVFIHDLLYDVVRPLLGECDRSLGKFFINFLLDNFFEQLVILG